MNLNLDAGSKDNWRGEANELISKKREGDRDPTAAMAVGGGITLSQLRANDSDSNSMLELSRPRVFLGTRNCNC